jgi:hypothetical protein
MGVRRLPPTNEAGLRRHELQMGAIAVATRFAQGKAVLSTCQRTALLTGDTSG